MLVLGLIEYAYMNGWLGLGWVALGAVLGAGLRWQAQLWLNQTHPTLPLGTLLVNVLGGFLIGLAIGYQPGLSSAWRLLLVTGFLGAFTTFSSFSAETFQLLEQGKWLAALFLSMLHLFGSLIATAAGFCLIRTF